MTEDKKEKSPFKILIVDDVEANRFILGDIIADMGYQPVLTKDGVQALKMLEHITPKLIILDIAMPVMDGYEACSRIKENPDTREIPIIFISAFDDPKDIVKGFELGGAEYITKPFIPEVVKARVDTLLKLSEVNVSMQEMNRRLQISVNEQKKQMERERQSVLYALIRIARENAYYDEKYMERLAYNCRVLTEAMQLFSGFEAAISDSYVKMIELAAPLCDLGNIAIPSNILQKQGGLTEEESTVVKTHTIIGARILRDIEAVANDNALIHMATDIANYHHENWDGSGYPESKAGNDIPLAAQIVAVVSTYCALTEDRSYRVAFEKERAIDIMGKDAGIKFNPEIFGVMKKIIRQLH